MGFVVPYATRLSIIIGILFVALREICLHLLDMLGLYREPSCTSSIHGGSDYMPPSDLDNFQYPYLTMNFNGSLSMQSTTKSSLVSLVYEGAEECGKEVNARCGGKRHQLAAETSMDCSVCLSEFEKGQHLRIMPNCCHVFHRDCIHKWLDQDQKTCPLCRTSLVSLQYAATGASATS
ncbi:hypothetical protein GOP47_0015154 [Adiantum capillus-veneris]|uniref:RING-type domain-containing protein n=1 Tax=Adiantum capillus-veneris TaxID=13818 RepID=A0A9D4ZFF8_ADICA|nr:hypothetical protein GOP47_0015154 [Adiantum capillus-veneris]